MKKTNFRSNLIVIIIIVFAIFLIQNNTKENAEVCIEGNCFFVELAKTNIEKSKGLMFKEFLKDNEGMLFIYDSDGEYNFWMQNTLISLDIIWINAEREVIFIKHEALPCGEICNVIEPKTNARFVLEINGRLSETLGINIGDKFDFNNIF